MKIGKRSNFTEGDIRVIRWRVGKGESRREIAQEYGVSKQTIDKIYWRDTFAHVRDNPEDELANMDPISPIDLNEAEASFVRLQSRMPKTAFESKTDAEGEHIPTPDELYGDQEDELQTKKDI